MPQDPHLYGQAPPKKKQRKEMELPGSLAFTSQLSSLLATATTNNTSSSSTSPTASAARPRPSKSKTTDLFNGAKVKRKIKPNDSKQNGNKLTLKETLGSTEDEKAERLLARRKMESKARLYAAMQRGDYVGREIGLVDFDRKWAEQKKTNSPNDSSSSGDDSSSEEDTELVEYTDEFGRVRKVTRAEKVRMERRVARGQASAAELEVMSARPKAPENLIFGDAVQVSAFEAQDADAMEQLARKRDRSATPPPALHYQADREIRTKGVGFYAFSKDEEKRTAEMAALEAERVRTEQLRMEREEKVAARRKEIEERRQEIGKRKAKKLADSFLEGLGKDMFTPSSVDADGGGGGDVKVRREP
ncbi:hypothetical protein B0H66DRAFT_518781 [Apodospora peruviana]|uniref:Uncharacterized protein n=1 Tax=Apodospora peruviana TaxID=516989 RepID=A0AAE0I052_9PEZI|nr:hypothetical protein B0H66DRAFT_518781 [Apodospora peruviana]